MRFIRGWSTPYFCCICLKTSLNHRNLLFLFFLFLCSAFFSFWIVNWNWIQINVKWKGVCKQSNKSNQVKSSDLFKYKSKQNVVDQLNKRNLIVAVTFRKDKYFQTRICQLTPHWMAQYRKRIIWINRCF